MLFWSVPIVVVAVGVLIFFRSKKRSTDTFASHVLPHGELVKLCEGVYQVEGSLPHGVGLPRNMVVYQIPKTNSLLLHSVIALNEEEMKKLEELGDPNIIIVPNHLHTLDASVYQRRYPHIKTFCPASGLNAIKQKVHIDGTCEEFLPTLGVQVIQPIGIKPGESIYSLPTADNQVVLVFGDLLFNVTKEGKRFLDKLIYLILGTRGRLQIGRLGKILMLKDRTKFIQFIQKDIIESLNDKIAAIAVCHGDAIIGCNECLDALEVQLVMALPTFKILVLAAVVVIFLLSANLFLFGGQKQYEVVNIEEEEIFTYKPANTQVLVDQSKQNTNNNNIDDSNSLPILNNVDKEQTNNNNIYSKNPINRQDSPVILQPVNIPANYPTSAYNSLFMNLNRGAGNLNPFQNTPAIQMLTQEQFEKKFDYPQPLNESYSFVCKMDLLCSFLKQHLTTNYALTDVTTLYNQFFYVQTVDQLPPSTSNWCTYVVGASSVSECLIEALIRKSSPLGNISLIMGGRLKVVVINLARKFPAVYSRLMENLDIFFMDEQIPAQLSGDKAGYSIKLIQTAPKDVQEQALEYMPRSYYINTPCYKMNESEITLDQWDLWLNNLDYDTAGYRRERPTELQYLDTENRDWDRKQPRIEGENTWVIKPTLMNIRDVTQVTDDERFHLHQGNAIHVVRTPEDIYKAVVNDLNIYERDCIGNYRIIQKYIENPFLWGTKKADIRVYVLVTSMNPPTGYIYTGEYPVRVARSDYNSTDDRAHVTNFSKAQKEENVDNMHYWEEFFTYICATLDQPRAEVEARILSKLKVMVKSILRLFENEFHLPGATSITGWDVIFDKDLNPWMMEINPKPDMRMEMSHMSHFKIPLVSEAVDLSLRLAKGEEPPQTYGSFVYLN